MWFLFAFGSAFFAGITAILAKCGIRQTDSAVATALRTVVLIMSVLMVLVAGSFDFSGISGKTWLFLILSGIATGASWLCYYKALQTGVASTVIAVDKLSILFTVLFSRIVFKEKLCARSLAGLILIVAGTLCMLL